MTTPIGRTRRYRALAAFFSGLVLTLTALSGAAAVSPLAEPTPDIDVQIESITPQVLAAGQDLTVTAIVTNTSSRQITTGTTTLSMAAYRIGSRAEAEAWLGGRASGLTRLARVALDAPLEPGASITVKMTAPATSIALSNVWGPRGLQVTFDGGSTARGQVRSFLLWSTTESIPQAHVALIAAITAPATTVTLPTLSVSTASPAPSPTNTEPIQVPVPGSVADAITTAQAIPELTLAIDPILLDGADGPSQGLDQLMDSRESVILPWSDPDLAAIGQAGATDLLATAARLSQTKDLGEIAAWSMDPVSPAVAEVVGAAGVTTLIDPSGLSPAVTTTETSGGSVTVLTADQALSDLFTDPDLSLAEAEQEALALLAISARADEPALIAADRDWAADPTRSEHFVAALRNAPWVRFTSPSDLPPSNAATTMHDEATPVSALDAASVHGLTVATADLARFSMITDSPNVITADVDEAVLAPLAYAWRSDPTGRSALVTQTLTSIGARRNGVSLTPRTDITVINTSNEVLVNVRNTLPVPVTVRVRLDPSKPCLTGVTSEPVTLPAGTDSQVSVTLLAHANCQVKIRAWLISDDGSLVSTSPLEFGARVSPSLESLGTAVVGAILALGLVIGVIRTIRRGKSAHRVEVPDQSHVQEADVS